MVFSKSSSSARNSVQENKGGQRNENPVRQLVGELIIQADAAKSVWRSQEECPREVSGRLLTNK